MKNRLLPVDLLIHPGMDSSWEKVPERLLLKVWKALKKEMQGFMLKLSVEGKLRMRIILPVPILTAKGLIWP